MDYQEENYKFDKFLKNLSKKPLKPKTFVFEPIVSQKNCPTCGSAHVKWDVIECPNVCPNRNSVNGCNINHEGYVCLKCGETFD